MRTLTLLAAAMLLAGCASTTGTSAPTEVPAVAPTVADPKDARGIEPCALLTSAQAVSLGLDPARAEAGATADLVDCIWWAVQPPVISVAVSIDTNPTRRGLTDTYLKRSTFQIFEPLVVDGYPAVRAEVGLSVDCTIYLGLSDTQDLRVDVGARSPADTCGLVKRAISAMLTNIPPQR